MKTVILLSIAACLCACRATVPLIVATPVAAAVGVATWPIAAPVGIASAINSDGSKNDRIAAAVLIGWPIGLPYMMWEMEGQ